MPLCALNHGKSKVTAAAFQKPFFERTAVYADANRNLRGVRSLCNRRRLFRAAEIPGIYPYFVNAVVDTGECKSIIKMNVGDNGNR